MLLVDDILLFPARSLLWVFREIHHAAEEELGNESARITQELSELYMLLETGRITEAEFDAREKKLLDRLDRVSAEEEEPGAADDDAGEMVKVEKKARKKGRRLEKSKGKRSATP